jgi:hypothetical protein
MLVFLHVKEDKHFWRTKLQKKIILSHFDIQSLTFDWLIINPKNNTHQGHQSRRISNTVKPAHAVTRIKRSLFSCPVVENFI